MDLAFDDSKFGVSVCEVVPRKCPRGGGGGGVGIGKTLKHYGSFLLF